MNYYDSIAEGYNELHGEEQRRKYRIIKEHLQLPENSRVLDVGAGTGIGSSIIPSVGIDPAEKLIKQHPNKESIVGSAEQLPYPDKSFDAVISVTAIHHTNYQQAIAEMLRVSRGPLAITILKKSAKASEIRNYCQKILEQVVVIEEDKDFIIIHNSRKH